MTSRFLLNLMGLLAILSWTYLPDVHGQGTAPQQYIIGNVRIEGATHLNQDVLITISGLRPGSTITIPGDDLKDAVQRLWKQQLFETVSIYAENWRRDTVDLVIRVRTRPRIRRYTIRGLRRNQQKNLAEFIGSLKGKALTPAFLESLRARILHYYRKDGYLLADVQISWYPDTLAGKGKDSAWAILVIQVHRGPRVRIHRIHFLGNHALPDHLLKKQMKETREYPRIRPLDHFSLKELFCGQDYTCTGDDLFHPDQLLANIRAYFRERIVLNLFTQSRYDPEKLDLDLRNVILFYNDQGFRNARILKDTFIFRDDGNIDIWIQVHEGRRFYFGQIRWVGNHIYPDSVLQERLGIQPGDVYSRDRLMQQLMGNPAGTDVASLYMDHGYLFFNATPVEIQIRQDTIDLEIRIYEGPQARIDRVTISGNTKTHDHVIRRELYTIPGNIFSRRDLVRSQQQLAALNLFDPEQLNVTPDPDPHRGTVNLHYEVVERPSDQIEFTAGYIPPPPGSDRLGFIVGSLGLILNNFSFRELFTGKGWDPIPSGDAQKFTIRAQSSGPSYMALTFSVSDPWFGGRRPNSFTIAMYYNRISSVYYQLPGTGPLGLTSVPQNVFVPTSSQQITWGGNVSWGFRLRFPDDYFTLYLSLEYQRIQLRNVTFLPEGLESGGTHNIFAELRLSRVSLDQLIFPRQGSSLTFTLRLTPPYSLWRKWRQLPPLPPERRFEYLEYYRTKVDLEWYIPLTADRKLVFRTRYSFGFLGAYNPELGPPPLERFELGGDGFTNFALYGKEVVSLRGYDPFLFSMIAFQKVTFELRYPLSLNPMSTIYALFFLEGGNAWRTPEQIDLFQLYRSAGIGIRFLMPMVGLMGVDFGIGFDTPFVREAPPTTPWGYLRSPYTRVSIVLGFEPY